MPNYKRFESILFNYETTDRTEFRDGEITPIITTKYKEKPVCVGIRPPPLKYIHTFTDWEEPTVPIDLYLKPKRIVRTHPRDIQQEYGVVPDLEKEAVRKTRPRLVMTPAASLDDMKDEELRDKLLADMYDTTAKRAMRLGIDVPQAARLNVPRPKELAPPNPFTIPKLHVPYVSPEWRMDSVSWDARQLRTYAHPTRDFWLTLEPRCEECQQTAARNAIKRMKLR